ncbi:hypothetical protein AYO47_07590 [Planctomyces sp. SCGC AG-212-M04]|nr:hypothetical protein AYO47_07590 [Planctomyces sp. SCGC AG-212-M04]
MVAVAILVVGVLFVSWRLGSSGVDKRYVGKWIDKNGQVTNLGADGHFSISADGETDDFGQRWWVSGSRLVLYNPSPTLFENAGDWIVYFGRLIVGKLQWGRFEECEVTKFDGQTLQLDGELELKRVPESAKQ